jgi:hypothetical protein
MTSADNPSDERGEVPQGTPPDESRDVPQDATAPPPEAPAQQPTSGASFGWFERWLGAAQIEAARSRLWPAERLRVARRAAAHLEAARHALDPANPLGWGEEEAVATSLLREAARLALLAAGEEDGSLEELLQRRGGPAGLRLLLEPGPRSTEQLAALHAQIDALLTEPLLGPRELQVAERRRLLRVGLLAAVGLALVVGLFGVKKTNLAQGKPWRTSSSAFACKPQEHQCGGARTDILFHTKEENSPWFEVDLGQPTAFSEVLIKNRSDGFQDRASPLVVEVSDNRTAWREVARKVEVFRSWKALTPGARARYLRVRVDRRSTLHLESVEVR